MEPVGTVDTFVNHRVGLLIHLVQGQSQLDLWSSQGDCLAVGVVGWHLYEDSSLGQNLIDGVALGSNDILVLGLLDLHGDGAALLLHLLPGVGDGGLDSQHALLLSSNGQLVLVDGEWGNIDPNSGVLLHHGVDVASVGSLNEWMINLGHCQFLKSLFGLFIGDDLDLVHGLVNSLLVALDDDPVIVVSWLGDGDLGGGHLLKLLELLAALAQEMTMVLLGDVDGDTSLLLEALENLPLGSHDGVGLAGDQEGQAAVLAGAHLDLGSGGSLNGG